MRRDRTAIIVRTTMAAIRELLAEVREDAVAGALLGDADVDDVLLVAVTLLLEVAEVAM